MIFHPLMTCFWGLVNSHFQQPTSSLAPDKMAFAQSLGRGLLRWSLTSQNRCQRGYATHSSLIVSQMDLGADQTRLIAMDCEMVTGISGQLLAQAVVVDWRGDVLYNRYVRIREPVVDYATRYSGIRPYDVSLYAPNTAEFEEVRNAVRDLLKVDGRVLVGHALVNDMRALNLDVPPERRRDTQRLLRRICKRTSLASLAYDLLGIPSLQSVEHNAVQDARATVAVYLRVANAITNALRTSDVPCELKELKLFLKRKPAHTKSLTEMTLIQLGKELGKERMYTMVKDIAMLGVDSDEVECAVRKLVQLVVDPEVEYKA